MSKFVTAQGVSGRVAFNLNQLSSVHWSARESRIELFLNNGKEIDLARTYKESDVDWIVKAIHHAEEFHTADEDLDEIVEQLKQQDGFIEQLRR